MKKSYIFTLAAAAMAFLAGCQKSEITMSEQTADAQTIRVKVADFNPSTKVSAVDITAETVKFQWELNDTIMFVNMASNTDTLRFLCTDAGTGTFKNISSKDLDADSPYRIYYPASGYKAILESGVPHETYRGNQIPREHLIAGLGSSGAGYPGDLTEFTLDSHMPVIHLKLKGTAKIGSIEYYKGETSLSSVLECGDGVQLDAETPTDFYLTVCEADESSFSMSFYDVSGQELTSKTSKMNLTGCFNTIVDMPEITVNATEDPDILPDGALSGEFSVSATKKVRFSQGNLVATIDASGAPTDWKFAANQYDCLGEGGANQTIGSAAGDVDLFGWSTLSTVYGINTSTTFDDYSGDFKDWGTAIDDKGTWRTLSTDEWQYLFAWNSTLNEGEGGFDTSSPRYNLFKHSVIVCGKADCVILLPDTWDENVISRSNFASQTTYNNESTPTWDQMEIAGAVCLPVAGSRYGSYVSHAGEFGTCWSSSDYNKDCAYGVFFANGFVDPCGYTSRYEGNSVRLVTDVN